MSSMQLDPRQRMRAHPVSSELQERRSADRRRPTSTVPDVVSHRQRAEQFGVVGTSGISKHEFHTSLNTVCTGFCNGLVTSGVGTALVLCGRMPSGSILVMWRHSGLAVTWQSGCWEISKDAVTVVKSPGWVFPTIFYRLKFENWPKNLVYLISLYFQGLWASH